MGVINVRRVGRGNSGASGQVVSTASDAGGRGNVRARRRAFMQVVLILTGRWGELKGGSVNDVRDNQRQGGAGVMGSLDPGMDIGSASRRRPTRFRGVVIRLCVAEFPVCR